MPYLSLCAILEQLGNCYKRNDMHEPVFTGALKRALYYFGGYNEEDTDINVIYALRNCLVHNASLVSRNELSKNPKKHSYYYFSFEENMDSVLKNSSSVCDGDYDKLNGYHDMYTTYVGLKKFKEMVFNCILKASHLNSHCKLDLDLDGGLQQLYFDYILDVPRVSL